MNYSVNFYEGDTSIIISCISLIFSILAAGFAYKSLYYGFLKRVDLKISNISKFHFMNPKIPEDITTDITITNNGAKVCVINDICIIVNNKYKFFPYNEKISSVINGYDSIHIPMYYKAEECKEDFSKGRYSIEIKAYMKNYEKWKTIYKGFLKNNQLEDNANIRELL